MPPKKKAEKDAKKNADRFKVDGRTFTWTTEDGDTIALPLRLNVKDVRELNDRPLDASGMYELLERVAPDQAPKFDEMDFLFDFQPMYEAWHDEYESAAGATVGE
jgi:hypothetical protein